MLLTNQEKLLDEMFDKTNEYFFKGKLEKPVITIQSQGSKKNILGWCTAKKSWEEKDNTEKEYYEINIVAEYLNNSLEEIFATLQHECIHLENLILEIPDCSANNKYHNKKFKEACLNRGLEVKHDSKVGWGITFLNEEGKKFFEDKISSINGINELNKVHRKIFLKEKKENLNKMYGYECDCGIHIKSKINEEELEITCDKCASKFKQVESKRGRKSH